MIDADMARIDFKDGYFHGLGTWNERSIWPRAGFWRSPTLKAWITDDREIAESVRGVTWTDAAMAEIATREAQADVNFLQSFAKDSTFEPPVPDGLHPRTGKPFAFFPYQKAGIEYALQRQDTLIGDAPGLGKSPMGVGVFNADPLVRNVVVICPASLKEHWRREFLLWKTKDVTVGIAETKYREKFQDGTYKNGNPRIKSIVHPEWWPNTNVVIINYDVLHRFTAQIHARKWDMLICDEAHALKTEDSGRTLFVFGGRKKEYINKRATYTHFTPIEAPRRLFLTGTPIMNRPFELWPIIHSVDPKGLGKNRVAFGYQFCGGYFDAGTTSYDFSGASNEAELGRYLRSTFMIRRARKEVMPELPEQFKQIITVTNAEIEKLVDRESEIAEALKLYVAMLPKNGETEFDVEAAQGAQAAERAARMGLDEACGPDKPNVKHLDMDYATALTGLSPPDIEILFEEMASVRRELGIAKVGIAVTWIKEFLKTEDKLLVFAYHTDVLLALNEALAEFNPVLIYGGVHPNKRQARVDIFQDDERCRLALLQTDTAGVGYTLTRAKDCCFVEGDWVPTKLSQAFDRICRIGQKAAKLMGFFLVANKSLDCKMAWKVEAKQEIISSVLDTEAPAAKSLL